MRTDILKTAVLLPAFLTLWSCSGTKDFVKVENIKDISQVKHNPVIYALPKTVVSVKVTAVNEISVKGPYSQYAQKYIGTDDIINSNSSTWTIGNIEISSFAVKDTSRIFAVEASYPCSMNFSENGFLESVNAKSDYKESHDMVSEKVYSSDPDYSGKSRMFQDININRYETVFDTVLHVIDADSIFTAVPTQRKQVIRKSLDEQAQELANQIFVLRDDRNALLVGESDGKSLPEGEALKFMIEQLNKLEESYMSMFIGKKIRVEKTYIFNFEPENTEHSQNILFKFSPQYGIQSRSSLKGNPIVIDVTNLAENSLENSYNERQMTLRRKAKAAEEENGFAYLSGANGNVKIMQNGNVISEKVMNISQMGLIRYLPQSLMKDKNFKMVLYPEKGTIKSLN
ncbi:MAG: DUF4831 family protein [Bacteroidales bacterium]|nr:DUF4831 family protein [Bacteroidales bacterium]